MNDKKTYQWLVQKGKIQIYEEFPHIYLELDYENQEFCELNTQDILEIRNILYTLSSNIWSQLSLSDKPTSVHPKIEHISNTSFKWSFSDSAFFVTYNFADSTLRLQYEKKNKFTFSVNSIVEIIQILDHYLDNLQAKT